MVLDSPYALHREEFDYKSFMREKCYRDYERLVLGTRTISDMIGRSKYIDSSVWPVTPTETARPYIRMIWQEQCARPKGPRSSWMGYKRVPWSRATFPMLWLNPPMFFERPSTGDLTYVDIRAAYFQLYSPATLDLRFDPTRRVFGQGMIEFLRTDELATLKETRNTIIGILRARERTQCSHGHVSKVPTYNRFLAPELWGYLMHTLHALAHEVLARFDVRYMNTDGFIVPTSEAPLLREFLAEEWGLETTIKGQGEGSVWALGAYTLGDLGSRSRAQRGEPMCNLLPRDRRLAADLKRWRWWLVRRELHADTRMTLAATDTLEREEAGVGEFNAPGPRAEYGKPVPTAGRAAHAPPLHPSAPASAPLFRPARTVERVRLAPSSAPAGGALFRAAASDELVRLPAPAAATALFRAGADEPMPTHRLTHRDTPQTARRSPLEMGH